MTLDPRLTMDPGHPTPATPGAKRKCWRHDWRDWFHDVTEPLNPGYGTFCARCGKLKDEAVVARNRKSRGRGRRTESGLADYLGGQNVGSLGWSWDTQGEGWRLQSKREAAKRSAASILALIEAIPAGPYLRGAYIVRPGQRLTSGECWFLFEEWVGWHGWKLPDAHLMVVRPRDTPLIGMGLPTFRELHVGEAAA